MLGESGMRGCRSELTDVSENADDQSEARGQRHRRAE